MALPSASRIDLADMMCRCCEGREDGKEKKGWKEEIEEYGQGRMECTAYGKKVVLDITAYN